jgi:hypothetical protein
MPRNYGQLRADPRRVSLTIGILVGMFVIGNVLGVAVGTGAATLLYRSQLFAGNAGVPGSPARASGASLSSGASGGAGTDTAAQVRRGLTDVVGNCRLANLRQEAALTTAAVSLGQWSKHIEAMNLLVAGKITLAAARNFWEATRIAATEHASAFRIADAELTAQGASCPLLTQAQAAVAPPQQLAALVTCRNALAAHAPVLAQARTGVSMWEHHIHMMEMLRDGKITPAQATAAWLKIWKAGDRQLRSYRAAVAAAGPGCPIA